MSLLSKVKKDRREYIVVYIVKKILCQATSNVKSNSERQKGETNSHTFHCI